MPLKVAGNQPYFFPYIGYWQLINAVDKYVIAVDVNYIRNGWIHRNRILVNREKSKFINLQIHNASSHKLINETQIFRNDKHISSMLKTIKIHYKKAPYFESVFPLIEKIITHDENNLACYLEYLILEISSYLGIETEFILSSDIPKNPSLRGQDAVIEICKILGADEYLNAIGGQKLYSPEAFAEEGIKLKFLKTYDIRYPQFKKPFIPNLSIIDVMMFNSRDEVKKMLEGYALLTPVSELSAIRCLQAASSSSMEKASIPAVF